MIIKRQPKVISPNNSPLMFEVESSDSGLTNFRYDLRLETDGTKIADKKIYPFPDGSAKFDASIILENYLSPIIQHGITGTTELTDRLMPYDMSVGYISNAGNETPVSTGERYIINAVDDGFDFEDFMMNGDGRFLTNSPTTLNMYIDDYYNLDFIIGTYSGITSEVDQITIEVEFLLDAKIYIIGSLDVFVNSGTTSSSQSYVVSAEELMDDMLIEAPEGFEISLNDSTWVTGITLTPTDFNISDTTIYVRFIGDVKYQDYSNFINHKTMSEFKSRIINETLPVDGYFFVHNADIDIVSTMVDFEAYRNIETDSQFYYVNGTGLVGDLLIEGSDGFKVSLDNSVFLTGLTISPIDNVIDFKLIYVRFKGTSSTSSVIIHTTFNEGENKDLVENLNVSVVVEEGTTFETEWLMTSGDFTFPAAQIPNSSNSWTFNAYIDWGDETETTHITSYNDVNLTHNYTTDGTYRIKVYGLFPRFRIHTTDDRLKLRKIISWGNVGFRTFFTAFYHANNLSSLPSGPITGLVIKDQYDFYENNYYFYQTFNDTNITSIPSGLFDNATFIVGQYSFYGTFLFTNITSIPSGLFDKNTLVSSFFYTFGECYQLTSIPSGLFDKNTLVSTHGFMGTFMYNEKLTSVPELLFKYNINCTSFSQTFKDCVKLRLNSKIFYDTGEETTRFLNKSVTFIQCFDIDLSFTGTRGTAPNLWDCDFGTGTPTTTYCFEGHSTTSLSNYSSIPPAWK